MLKYGLMVLLAIAMVGWGRSPALATPRHYTDLQLPPAPEIKIPNYTRFTLSNGIQVFLLEDHDLPLVGGSAMVRTGDRLEPSDKTGLAGIVGNVMRSGGTRDHSAEALNLILEQRAASIETGIDTTSGTASFTTLSEDLEAVFGLFAEVLRQPAFPQEKIDLAKTQIQGAIARRNDDPEGIAGREFQKLIYGAESPYARTIEYATLDKISRNDVMSFYQQSFQPSNILLGIVGDFDSVRMRSLIKAELEDWEDKTLVSQIIPSAAQAQLGGVFLVDQPQLTQSSIQIGHLGGKLDDPDYAALSVLNEVMNGLGGRLVNSIRSRQGLAYSVYAFWSPEFDFPGTFVAGGQTRSEATVPFIQSTLAEIEQVRDRPITETELTNAKESVLNAFIFRFATPAQTLGRFMRYEYYGYPPDFIFRYQKAVETTTIADVQQAAQRHLKPDQLVTLVVGNAAAMLPPLSTIDENGKVTELDVTIPRFKA
ncbi:MAG: insulinase family protein [Drouetiella hepatica Uher 2000/2452]|jgi:zinc protease|uniref:Insulinase family protein n=1 Tax=Drouetiella hepatica Uher 2000/2452 TaxID=904376 RepID=A0A951Q815_9CYAN|nr:insulinase family protein [Drouetiella hepatica Uher 2000/2452]